MDYSRASGIILHPTSLPGPDGIGDLGTEAYNWINFLSSAGCSLWQILPLGPTGYGDSPYQCFSAYAGNPYLVSSTLLLDQGLLSRTDLADRPIFPSDHVDYGPVIQWKINLLDRSFKQFQAARNPKTDKEFNDFVNDQSGWIDDFSLFMAIKESQGGVSWDQWPLPLRMRDQKALQLFRENNSENILRHAFRQFLFFRQWNDLKAYANSQGIQIIGDIPIFVAFDSADAWSHPELFYMDAKRKLLVVAGVPPDYFSPTGQRWGNPIYRWDYHIETGFQWWIERIKRSLQQVDIIRLDHFRGFAAYWEVPASEKTAVKGKWKPGPGEQFFNALQTKLGELPIIAEDLGEITPDVNKLLDQFNLPGMKVLQFAFQNDPDNDFLPHNYPVNCVAYSGTHDNDTTRGWFESAPEQESDFCRRYLACSDDEVSWEMIRAVWSSVAVLSLAPMQDFLNLGNEARMNFPGKASNNWGWRLTPGNINNHLSDRIHEINYLYGRLPKTTK